jgi:tRNA A37 threonylcarbamoyltransferase TsaD
MRFAHRGNTNEITKNTKFTMDNFTMVGYIALVAVASFMFITSVDVYQQTKKDD